MNRIFITGICGFLGYNLANYFQLLGNKVYGIDNLTRKGSEKNFNLLKNNGVKVFKGDLVKLKKFKLFKNNINFQAFIHCAALTSILDGTNNTDLAFSTSKIGMPYIGLWGSDFATGFVTSFAPITYATSQNIFVIKL